jgi:hypothetical protein
VDDALISNTIFPDIFAVFSKQSSIENQLYVSLVKLGNRSDQMLENGQLCGAWITRHVLYGLVYQLDLNLGSGNWVWGFLSHFESRAFLELEDGFDFISQVERLEGGRFVYQSCPINVESNSLAVVALCSSLVPLSLQIEDGLVVLEEEQ